MKKLGFTIQLLVLCSLTGVSKAYAEQENPWQTKSIEPAENEASLTITPSICVVKAKGELCQQILTVLFQNHKRHNICIYNAQNAEPLWCDRKVNMVSLKLDVKTSSSITLIAKDSNNNKILATSTFRLSTFKPAETRKRRNYGIGIL